MKPRPLYDQAHRLEVALFAAWLKEPDQLRAVRLRLAYLRAVDRCFRRWGR